MPFPLSTALHHVCLSVLRLETSWKINDRRIGESNEEKVKEGLIGLDIGPFAVVK